MTTASVHPQVAAYLSRLDAALATLPHADAKDILREIEAHIIDSLPAGGDDPAVKKILDALGSPESLAQGYGTEALLTRASHSFSPWLLLQTTWRWAKTGIRGFIVFLVGLIGYGMGFGFTITVVLKAIIPSRVGLWVGPQVFSFGYTDQPGVHELLGAAYIPVATVLAFGTVVATTQALRWLIRKRTSVAGLSCCVAATEHNAAEVGQH
jgi:hypothetical protein